MWKVSHAQRLEAARIDADNIMQQLMENSEKMDTILKNQNNVLYNFKKPAQAGQSDKKQRKIYQKKNKHNLYGH